MSERTPLRGDDSRAGSPGDEMLDGARHDRKWPWVMLGVMIGVMVTVLQVRHPPRHRRAPLLNTALASHFPAMLERAPPGSP